MPDNGPEKRNDWLALKVPGTTAVAEYEFAARAAEVYALYAVGYELDEIAAHLKISEYDAESDLMYIRKNLTSRQVISMSNDRERIILQKKNAQRYRRIMEEGLDMSAKDYAAAGLSPVGIMKEYREAVSMTEKPGGLSLSFTKNTQNIVSGNGVHPVNISGRNGIKSYEDLVRMIIEQDPSCALQPVDDDVQDNIPPENIDAVIDAESESQSIDDGLEETDGDSE